MPNVKANGIELEYETFGDPARPPVLLIMGLGAQMISWDDDFVGLLVDRGHHVIRFDNRDVGLSSKIEGGADLSQAIGVAMAGGEVGAPYTLSDMAADAAGLLDALAIPAAHVVGASMGGMIAQTLAVEHPEKVLSLTSIMSSTGDLDVGQPTGEALERLLVRPPDDRDGYVEHSVATSKVIGSPGLVDEARVRDVAIRSFDRCYLPAGVGRQLLAILASGSRTERLRGIEAPTLVIHGTADPLVQPTGGRRTAEVIPGAELVEIEGMGHDLPRARWPQVVDAICALIARAGAGD